LKTKLTREGHEKLEAELKYLKTVKSREVIAAIAEARSKGDLRENAEYDAAREAQGHLEKRIVELDATLAGASLIDDTHMDHTKAFLGAYVTVENLANGDSIKFMLVSPEESDFANNKISITSPVGKALLGKSVGEEAQAQVPAGKIRYRITNISR